MPTKPSILLPSAGRLVGSAMAPSPAHLVLLGEAEVVGLVADGHAVLAEEDAEQPVEIAGDLRQERRHVGGAERNAGGADDFAAVLLDLRGIGVARRLAPGIVGIGDVPLLAHLGERGPEGDRLRRRVIVDAEAVAVAFAGGQRGVEAHADHVDDLGLLPDRHAGEADVGEEAADMDVDVVLVHQLLRSCGAPTSGLDSSSTMTSFDRPAVDAAVLVDAVDRHLQADHRGLAAGSAGARERLLGTDLVGLGGAEGRAPRRRHQHHRADRAAAPADERRRVTLPLYQMSCAQASSFHFSVIASPPSGFRLFEFETYARAAARASKHRQQAVVVNARQPPLGAPAGVARPQSTAASPNHRTPHRAGTRPHCQSLPAGP